MEQHCIGDPKPRNNNDYLRWYTIEISIRPSFRHSIERQLNYLIKSWLFLLRQPATQVLNSTGNDALDCYHHIHVAGFRAMPLARPFIYFPAPWNSSKIWNKFDPRRTTVASSMSFKRHLKIEMAVFPRHLS